MDTTGKAFVGFWKWAADKGLMNANTASGFRAAVSQVLSVADGWEKLDVTAMDPDDMFRRFVNKRSKDFTPGSLAAYKRRFVQAMSEFLEYTKNPDTWKPSSTDRSAARRQKRPASAAGNGSGKTGADEAAANVTQVSVTPGRAGLVEYPFPLREGRFAYLRLPADLNSADVKRLTAYLATLAIEPEGV